MESISFRAAVLADLPTLLEFEQAIVETERPFNDQLKPGTIHYYDIEAMIESREVALLVAVDGHTVVGSGYARIMPSRPYFRHQQHAYLGFMYLLPAYRGRGISQSLMAKLVAWAKSSGVDQCCLDVYSENTAAIKAYEKAGFKNRLSQMWIG